MLPFNKHKEHVLTLKSVGPIIIANIPVNPTYILDTNINIGYYLQSD